MISQPEHIVFYDGECGLCNKTVRLLSRIDTNSALHYAPLQGEIARRYLSDAQRKNLDTMYFRSNGQLYERSTATLTILNNIGFPWKLLYALIILPRPIRDACYNFIAKRRITLFGGAESCKLPSEKLRKQLLP